MSILGRGDLAPPRRRRRRGRRIAALALVVALAAGGYAGYREWFRGAPAKHVARAPCPTPSPAPTPAAAQAVTLRVLNGTTRVNLAHRIAGELRRRGFHVSRVGNDSSAVVGRSVVSYGPGELPAAQAVAEQVPDAMLSQGGAPGVDLEIGSSFQGLASVTQAATARAHDIASARPSPRPCPRS